MIRLPELDVEKTASTLVKNIRALFQEKEFERAILGLSGGVDSALALALAREALGEKYIKGIIMPYKTSNPASQEDAIQLSQKFNTAYEVHPITPMADAYFERDPQLDAARRGNIMARLRMLTLYDLSARDNALVVGTGNKTEILLGYSTLWGDTACGLNPLGNLYKYQVYKLARHLGVTDSILNKAPSADLWQGQSDEGELGFSYNAADHILYFYIEEKKPLDELKKMAAELGEKESTVDTILSRIERFRFKRQLPPIVALT